MSILRLSDLCSPVLLSTVRGLRSDVSPREMDFGRPRGLPRPDSFLEGRGSDATF